MITIPLVKKIAELFLIMFAAAAFVKTGVFKADYSRVLSRISLNFVTPCVIVNSFLIKLTSDIRNGLLIVTLLAVGFQVLFSLVAAVLRRVWKATEVERASIVFTNAGNLVIPLVSYALGQEWVIYTSGYILVFNVMFWTVGIRMFDDAGPLNIRKILLNPNVLAVVAGLILLFTGITLPEPLSIAFSDVASMIGPLSMMITGMVVGSMKFRDMFVNRRIFGVILFRMVVCSGIAVLLAAFSGIAGRIPSGKAVVMIPLLAAIAPSASNINQAAILYDKDAPYASAINILTTLSCIIFIPLWVLVYETIVG
ncbi:MAG: AEC family transporter [Clostridia bacterium]|nr:AEC family transporter [Clostridia bacterium]